MDMDYGRFTGHPADPRTVEPPEYALSQATEHALAIPAHWASFLAEAITEYDSADIKAFRIKPEDVCDQDTATLLVLAITGTNEQAAAARMYLQEAFCEHHAELIDQLATECDAAHDGGPDDWEAA
jgi:hypothetical protein